MQRELVERARRGDHDAFAGLANAAIFRLDAAARLILNDRDQAKDAVQETLVRAWRDLPTLRDPDRFEAGRVLHEGIFIANVDRRGLRPGESPRQLMAFDGLCPDPTRVGTGIPCGPRIWSPDGTRIFAPDIAGRAIVVLSVDGSQPSMTIDLPAGTELNPVNSTSW